MQDRLHDLPGRKSVQADVSIDMGEDGMDGEGEAFMPEFFEEVGQIKTLMSLIRRNIKAIQDEYNKQQWSASVDSKKERSPRGTFGLDQRFRSPDPKQTEGDESGER